MPVFPFHLVDLVQEPASVVDLKVKKTNEKLVKHGVMNEKAGNAGASNY